MTMQQPMARSVFDAMTVTLRDGRAVVLREAEPDDAPAVLDFFQLAMPDITPFVLSCPEEMDFDEPTERAILKKFKDKPGTLMMLVLEGESVVGMLGCEARAHRTRIAHIGEVGMFVAKTYWESGLGTAMMEALIAWADASPELGLLQLQVYRNNERAIRLYRNCGFVEAGTIPARTRFADGSTRDDVTMYRRVDGSYSDQSKPGSFTHDLGNGVVMRPIRYTDSEALFSVFDRNRERFRPWFRWEQTIRSVGDVRAGVATWIERKTLEDITFVLEESGQVIGLVFICGHSVQDHQIELGYWLDAGYEGRRLVTRACRALIRHSFESHGINRIDLCAAVENSRSRAVAQRLGMTQEAVLKQWQRFPDGRYVDVVRYRLLREDWQAEEAT
ncbi:MAG: GNAT family protein [Planctomycetota bacterium]